MAGIPVVKVTIENIDTISDRVLLWELCRRHKASWFSEGFNWFSRVIEIPVDGEHKAKLKMSEKAYKVLMGEI
jgi:hypothetical protein